MAARRARALAALARSDPCQICGGGCGVVSNLRAPPLRARVFELKRAQVEATGAEHLVTSCGQCRITLEMGARQAQWNRSAERLLELVADNLAD